MKKFLISFALLIAALAVIVVERQWFDGVPVEPEILGTGYVYQQESGIYTVKLEPSIYFVSEVYLSTPNGDAPVLSKPIEGALVTIVNFQNERCEEGAGVKFLVGRWNTTEQIEKAFHTNYVGGTIIMLCLIYAGVFVLIAASPLRNKKK